MSETFTAYVTKYALTRGILEVEAEGDDDGDGFIRDGVIWVESPAGGRLYFNLNEWHRTFHVARQHALVLRDREIASLERKIERLRKLSFATAAKL